MTNHYRIPDGTRFLEFEGTELAKVSTDDGRAQRWTELEVYRSTTGRYIVAKIGRSAVYHNLTASDSCGSHAKQTPAIQLYDVAENLLGCVNCKPHEVLLGGEDVLLEQPRYSVQISDTAQGLIETLHRRDPNGVIFIPNISREAIELAGRRDPALADAWKVQRV